MTIPFYYIFRNFLARKLTTGITAMGIALVVFVFTAVLMMAGGIEKTMVSTGSDDNIIVTRKASTGEISSIIDRETAATILTLPGIAKDAGGKPKATTDGVAIVNLEKQDGGISNIAVRGVSNNIFSVRPNIQVVKGRLFSWGSKELTVGESVHKRFRGAEIGNKIKFAGDEWTIVGVMAAEGSAYDSEIWGDILEFQSSFKRSQFSTLTFRMENKNVLGNMQSLFAADPRLNQFEPKIESKYYAEQSELMATFIKILGIFITVIFSVGSIIGAMITMYASVANRTTEIGTLRALGFRRRSILLAFVAESLLISLFGGIVGVSLASILQFFSISTLNFGSFSEIAFNFSLSPDIIVMSLLFSVVMGLVGGALPAFQAAKMNILSALRSV